MNEIKEVFYIPKYKEKKQSMVLRKSGQCIKECVRNKPELLIYDFEKTENDFGENGRISISDMLIE